MLTIVLNFVYWYLTSPHATSGDKTKPKNQPFKWSQVIFLFDSDKGIADGPVVLTFPSVEVHTFNTSTLGV